MGEFCRIQAAEPMLLTTGSVSLDLLSPDSPKRPAAGDVHKPLVRLVPPHCPLAHVLPTQADHPPGVEPAQEHLKLPRERQSYCTEGTDKLSLRAKSLMDQVQ